MVKSTLMSDELLNVTLYGVIKDKRSKMNGEGHCCDEMSSFECVVVVDGRYRVKMPFYRAACNVHRIRRIRCDFFTLFFASRMSYLNN